MRAAQRLLAEALDHCRPDAVDEVGEKLSEIEIAASQMAGPKLGRPGFLGEARGGCQNKILHCCRSNLEDRKYVKLQ
jgi:hypothetical protein